MKRPYWHSLSLRLLGVFIVTAILVVALVVLTFTRGLGSQWERSIRPHLIQYIQYVQQDLGNPPSYQRAEALAQRLPVAISIYHHDKLQYSTGSIGREVVLMHYRPLPQHLRQRLGQDGQNAAPAVATIVRISERSERRHQRNPVIRIDQGAWTVFYSLDRPDSLRAHRGNELWIALVALAALLICSYLIIRHLLSPIRRIQSAVGEMAGGHLNVRASIHGKDDLAALGNSVDAMAGRIEAMLDAKRQLLLALSHELRSPIARARVATSLLPDSLNRHRLERDLKEMERLINDIMESERLQHHAVLNRQWIHVDDILTDECASLSPLIEVTLPSTLPVRLHADPGRLRILIRNLLSNALQHGKTDNAVSPVRAILETDNTAVLLRIEDDGPGVEAQHLARIAEAFYRPDDSRTRVSGGFGLGLTLANLIAQAHGGSISIESSPTTVPGTRVSVRLPNIETTSVDESVSTST